MVVVLSELPEPALSLLRVVPPFRLLPVPCHLLGQTLLLGPVHGVVPRQGVPEFQRGAVQCHVKLHPWPVLVLCLPQVVVVPVPLRVPTTDWESTAHPVRLTPPGHKRVTPVPVAPPVGTVTVRRILGTSLRRVPPPEGYPGLCPLPLRRDVTPVSLVVVATEAGFMTVLRSPGRRIGAEGRPRHESLDWFPVP